MEVSEFMAMHRGEPVPVTPGQVLARHQQLADREDGADRLPLAEQAEEVAVRVLMTGYQAGSMSELALRAADTSAAIAAERAKIDAGIRQGDRVHRMFASGQIRAADVPGLLPDDPGSEERIKFLERRLESLRGQMGAAATVVQRSRQAEPQDPAEAAARRAHAAFREATRAMRADAAMGRAPQGESQRESRPFASASRGAVTAEVCGPCHEAGATAAEHVKLCGGTGMSRYSGDLEVTR